MLLHYWLVLLGDPPFSEDLFSLLIILLSSFDVRVGNWQMDVLELSFVFHFIFEYLGSILQCFL